MRAANESQAQGEFEFSITLQSDPSYLGQEFYFQGLNYDLSNLPVWAAVSNAVGIRIGDQ